jgi:hypothetical protein
LGWVVFGEFNLDSALWGALGHDSRVIFLNFIVGRNPIFCSANFIEKMTTCYYFQAMILTKHKSQKAPGGRKRQGWQGPYAAWRVGP